MAERKVSAQVEDFVGMYPHMDQKYVLKHASESTEEAWSWEEQWEKEGQERGENEERRVGPHGWLYGEQGVVGESWSKQQVLNMVQWVLHNGYIRQGGRIYNQIGGSGMGLKCAAFLANLACYGTEKRYAEHEGRNAEEVEHNYQYVDNIITLT